MVNLLKSTKPLMAKEIKRDWHLVDVGGKILGRATPNIARLLQGKHKVNYAAYLDQGDFVVVINAKKVVVTGRKSKSKVYTNYSGYPGGLRTVSYSQMMKNKPEEIIRHAVSGMIPKNKHRDPRLARLYIFKDEKHTYEKNFKSQISNVKSNANDKLLSSKQHGKENKKS